MPEPAKNARFENPPDRMGRGRQAFFFGGGGVNVDAMYIDPSYGAILSFSQIHHCCSARDWERSGLLEENPQSGCSEICASLKGPL